MIQIIPLPPTLNHFAFRGSINKIPVCALFCRLANSRSQPPMVRPILYAATLAFLVNALPLVAQSTDGDAVRVTVTMNPDGSKTVYQNDGANHQATATTTGINGKAQSKIVYKLDAEGRYESGRVFASDGTLRFKTSYRYDAAGRLAEETQLAKDDSIRNRIVYSYDAAGHQTGYAIYDREGRLIGNTTAKKPVTHGAP
jgi:YD repeat-containing protein